MYANTPYSTGAAVSGVPTGAGAHSMSSRAMSPLLTTGDHHMQQHRTVRTGGAVSPGPVSPGPSDHSSEGAIASRARSRRSHSHAGRAGELEELYDNFEQGKYIIYVVLFNKI